MRLVNWDSPLRDIENYLSKYNGSNGLGLTSSDKELTIPDWTPKVDIKETKDAYKIKAELAGVNKKDVSVTLEQGVLTIRGQKTFEQEHKDEKSHRVECSYGSFVRSFTLPESVQEESVTAKYKDGILNLNIPKALEAKQKNIEINVE